ncbi:Rrf2 family transcriptional regulator [Anaerovibrio sp. RM50]|uniref:RrF2 family transcriptional regulator n=1 Tax=Anaerovibrio sp. RM50 TaxID=1200557 RepID=UPI00047FF44F|nr:Rrf2 family transcriptional regulator [Anaerovibrio sp. RM50]
MISTRGRYALRVMIDLAERNSDQYIPLKDISARQEISKKYLEIIVKDLVVGEMIVGVSGKGGGYKLCRKPDEYTVGEILELIEGTISPVACLTGKDINCPRKGQCQTLPMWKEYDNLVRDFFYSKKLTDLVNDKFILNE